MSFSTLTSLFNPQSIAIIGASDKPNRIGFQVVKNLLEANFPGSVYPINPRLNSILQRPAYPSVEDVLHDIDLGIIVVRKDHVIDAVDACGRKGVRSLIIITSGYSETGDIEGERLLASRVKQFGMRMLGPNCAGFATTWEHTYASFENRLQQGHIAFISQSGAMCAVLLALARAESLGVSMFVSYGNAADIGPEEVLKYLGEHNPTQLIGCYFEGIQHARKFLSEARNIAPWKPIVVLKPGDTPAAVQAIQSHTGALAGDQAIYAGAFQQVGIHQTRTLDEFIDACKVLISQPLPLGDKVAIVTNSGGPGVLAIDACARVGLSVNRFSPNLVRKFQKFLPPFCTLTNPVDLGPEGDANAYQQVTEVLLDSSDVDLVLILCAPPPFADIQTISNGVILAKEKHPTKPLVTCWLSGDIVEEGIPLLSKADIPNFATPQRAATALRHLVDRAQWLRDCMRS